MDLKTINVCSLQLGSLVMATTPDNEQVICEVNGLHKKAGSYLLRLVRYKSRGNVVEFKDVNPIYITEKILSDNFDYDKSQGLWEAELDNGLNIEIFRSNDKYDNYVINVFNKKLHTYCSMEFLQMHQLQNILHYFNVDFKPDVSSYKKKK